MNEYIPFLCEQNWKVPQFRVVPIGRSITPENKILSYEMAADLILKLYQRHPKPVYLVSTPFVAVHNAETCSSCGVCVERCQMEVLQMEADAITQNPDRCIGCGLCVSTCPTDSIRLVRKPDSEQPEVPQDIVQNLIQLGKARGKITTPGLMKMMVKSKVDRLLTRGS